ncbi:MAG: glycosyl transferase family protein [uncultured bacterium]|nr:MAG: glycosyl transferase family protein [uncultured bacterium]
MTKKNTKFLIYTIVALLLATMVFLMFTSSSGDSATTDESTHIVSGYLANIDGDYNINTEHPYLGKKINTLPLLFMKVNLDRSEPYFAVKSDYYYDSWRESRQLGNNFLYKMGNDADQILRAVRSVPMILALIFGLVFFIIVSQLFGLWVGLLSLVFWVFSPDILAHSRFVNTDLWITVFYFLSITSYGYYLSKPNYKRLILAAIILGLALSVKFSSIILIPILFVLWVIKNQQVKQNIWLSVKQNILPVIIFLITSWIIVWANYGFSTLTPPKYQQVLDKDYYNQILVKTQSVARYFKPAEYYKGTVILSSNSFGNRPAYLLGEQKYGGWWYYFPVAFMVKTPLPILILIFGSIIFYLLRAKSRSTVQRKKLIFNDYLLISPIIIYLLISMAQKLNIGVRHLLPIMPFIFIWCAKLMVEFYNYLKNSKINRSLVLIFFSFLVFWLIFGTIRIYPHFLSYFNETVGASNGSQVLSDSNIDWGQDIKRLKTWLDDHKITQPILLEYYWDGDDSISYYGINYNKLERNDPTQKGYIAVGVSAVNNSEFSWLKNYKPIDQIGYSINIYNIK